MKNIKKMLTLAIFVGLGISAKAQTITSARFRIGGKPKSIRSYELIIDNSIVVGINDDSRVDYIESLSDDSVMDYNASRDSRNTNFNSYTTVGNYTVRYYTEYDIHDVPGKIKSIGNIQFKYTNAFDIHDHPGDLKAIGDIRITYYNAFDIHDLPGSIKSIGNVRVSYFNKMDSDNSKYGRVKSITGNSKQVSILYNNRYY